MATEAVEAGVTVAAGIGAVEAVVVGTITGAGSGFGAGLFPRESISNGAGSSSTEMSAADSGCGMGALERIRNFR